MQLATPGAPLHPAAEQPLLPVPATVRRLLRDTHDTFTLELALRPRPAFRPGQFAMLYVFGVGEVPISYSGSPLTSQPIRHTTRQVGAVTHAMSRLERGAMLGVRGPFGRPWPLDAARGGDVLLIAGGIGLAPLRSALCELAARRDEFGRVVLLYGARSPVDLLFRRDLARWRTRSRIEVAITVDRATRGWTGAVGVVPALVARAPIDPRRTTALLCGPEVMMRFAADALRRRGVDGGRIFVSLERNMKCAVGLCGRCQLGPEFVCKDGPVFPWDRAHHLLERREV